jgi:hypothetical protein
MVSFNDAKPCKGKKTFQFDLNASVLHSALTRKLAHCE